MNKNITIIDKDYKEWIKDLSVRYRRSQIKAAVKVNTEMLSFYWELGRDISKYDLDNKYGSRFYSVLSKDLQRELPNVSGLTERNIRYMKCLLPALWITVRRVRGIPHGVRGTRIRDGMGKPWMATRCLRSGTSGPVKS